MPALLAPQPIHPAQYAPAPVHRLKSPISLVQQKPSSQSTCSPSRRRPTGTPRRRRSHPRAERASHIFDQLPWISALEAAPEHTDPWDIADLSLLPVSDPSDSGPGPVRRRKTSLRSNPMGTSVDSAPSSPESSPLPPPRASASPPRLQSTPVSRFSPSRILFRNLMPVSHCDDGSPHHCINIRPLDF